VEKQLSELEINPSNPELNVLSGLISDQSGRKLLTEEWLRISSI
jgi:hypothetical protein